MFTCLSSVVWGTGASEVVAFRLTGPTVATTISSRTYIKGKLTMFALEVWVGKL